MKREPLFQVGVELGQRLYDENEEVRAIVDRMLANANRQDDPVFREVAMVSVASAQLAAWQGDRA